MTADSVNNTTLRFRIELRDIAPPIWRRIDVPGDYSFWDLHVAIQDAMGWLDYHLHAFRPTDTGDADAWEIGIPIEDEFMTGSKPIAGWTVRLASHFERAGDKMVYMYDFGDGWVHDVVLEEVIPSETPSRVACIAGERKCPPEDCGGTLGYQTLLEALVDASHEQHDEMMQWIGGSFDPEDFDPQRVRFDDPKERWNRAFKQN